MSVATILLAAATSACGHPQHVSIAEARLNPENRSLEVAMRLDAVHLEQELTRRTGQPVDLDDGVSADRVIVDYLRATFAVRPPGHASLPLHWVGREPEGLETWLYFELRLPDETPTMLEVRHQVLQERLTRQINTITFIIGEQRQTLRFTPDETGQRAGGWKRMTLPIDGVCSDRTAYVTRIDHWHAQRLERLRAEDGYLTLVGLHWLDEGRVLIGRGPEHDVTIPGLPVETLGTLRIDDGIVSFEAAAGVAVDGLPADGVLRPDAGATPTVLRIGTVRIHVIERGGRLGLRVRDAAAGTRTTFAGIARYPVDPAWRIEATFEPPDPDATVAIASVVGTVDEQATAGYARFEHGGKRVRMLLLPGSDPRHGFVVFGDRTNGRDTYGGGRFLVAERSEDGTTVVLDFNMAYNPPCAFTPFATCPLPPPENRLPFAVTAGERAPSD